MTTTIDLTLHLPDDPNDMPALVGDLRPVFPKTDALFNGRGIGADGAEGNNTIGDEVRKRLPAAVERRVVVDPEYSGFYAYGPDADLAVVRSTIEAMHAEGWMA